MSTDVQSDFRPILKLSEPPDSTPLLSDPARLRKRWEADGLLYFKAAIDQAAIAAARAEFIAKLKEVGVVAQHETQPVWNGVKTLDPKLAKPVSDSVWRTLVAHPSFDATVRSFLDEGEKPEWLPIVVKRVSPPEDPSVYGRDPFYAGHQDGVSNFGIDYITCWTPLVDIDETMGGLAVVPGSHRAVHFNKHPGERNVARIGVFPDAAWLRPNYKAGDVLIFHAMTVHAGLPNRSGMFRLSMDIRFLPSSVPRPIVGLVTAFDGVRVDIITESGEEIALAVDDVSIIRGPKGMPVSGDERSGILFPGANVIAAPGANGHARLVRSVSRKYLDLPAGWFTELPPNWVV